MMRSVSRLIAAAIWLATVAFLPAQDSLARREFQVDGATREALVHAPEGARSTPSPVVFAFHGHGGSMRNAARVFGYHSLWPQAIVVYPQGLNTPGRLTDPEGRKPGWQHGPGDQGDRDLRFFDVLLAALRGEFKVDENRLYATGHSNGGGFSYLLWATRGEKFAAFAPSAAAAARSLPLLKPKPVLHVAGEQDPLVKFEWQERTIEALRRINQCGEGRAWDGDRNCSYYPSAVGAPVVTAIHPGGHEFPRQAPAVIVKFFRGTVRSPGAPASPPP